MEDTLRESLPSALGVRQLGLNPCFNGRYSQRSVNGLRLLLTAESLNPCFNGRYSLRGGGLTKSLLRLGLNPCSNGRYSQST